VWKRLSVFWNVSLRRLIYTDVSGQPLCTLFKGQWAKTLFLDRLILDDGTKILTWKVGKKTTNLRRVKALKSDDFIQNSAEVWNPKCIRAKLFPRHYTAPVKRNKRVGRAPTATELGLDDRRTIIPFPVRKSGLLVLENIQNVTGAQPGSFTKFE